VWSGVPVTKSNGITMSAFSGSGRVGFTYTREVKSEGPSTIREKDEEGKIILPIKPD